MTKLKYIALALVVILIVTGYFVTHRDQGTDEAQIVATIDRGQEAIREKNLSKAMSCISSNYKDENGYNYDRIRLFGVEIFRSEADYNIKVTTPQIKVNGNDAVAVAKVGVTVGGGGGSSIYPTREITLRLKKEPVRRLLIYKVPEWKVISMENAVPMMDMGI